MGKGIEGGIVLLDIKHTRQELKDRLVKVNTEVGVDWDFDKEGVSDADAKKNLGLIESAEAAFNAAKPPAERNTRTEAHSDRTVTRPTPLGLA